MYTEKELKDKTNGVLKDILVDEYGYTNDDMKRSDGSKFIKKNYTEAILKEQELLNKEQEDSSNEETETSSLSVKSEESSGLPDFLNQGVFDYTPSKFKETDEIPVMSGVSNRYEHVGRQGRRFIFSQFGQTDKMPYSEIMAINSSNRRVLTDAWLIVLNEELIQELGLIEEYKHLLSPKQIDQLFSSSVSFEQFTNIFELVPEAIKVSILDKSKALYTNKQLGNAYIVNYLEDYFDYSFEDKNSKQDRVTVMKRNGN